MTRSVEIGKQSLICKMFFFLLGPHIFEAKVNKEKNFSTGTIARTRLTLLSLVARESVRTIKLSFLGGRGGETKGKDRQV